ncbi:MAG: hypothetical protein K2V38_29410, partial [Gemmataceae bacterium]|nr:hypothetical protein [Gemmataceae bacterium]
MPKSQAFVPGVQALYRLSLAGQLQGIEANGTAAVVERGGLRADALLGFRWLYFGENLSLAGNGVGVTGSLFPGPATAFTDTFNAR